ncbi:hypothetical protein OEZ86_008444 [Tetradesmus obliquus]|nr:hypothetical protein OEZ86_008444 [Tetradesmus obliquus]
MQCLPCWVRCNGCKPGFGGPSCDMGNCTGCLPEHNSCRQHHDFSQPEDRVIFHTGNATCSKALEDALVAKYNEEKQNAAADDCFVLKFTTIVINCTEVTGSSSGRKLSQFNFLGSSRLFMHSSTSSVTYSPYGNFSGNSSTPRPPLPPFFTPPPLNLPDYYGLGCWSGGASCGYGYGPPSVYNISVDIPPGAYLGLGGIPGAYGSDAQSVLWGSLGQAFDVAAVANLGPLGAILLGGRTVNVTSAVLEQAV